MKWSPSKSLHKEAQTLEQWFIENQRPLPWRETKDPYKIWISEVMLQQTTVKAVIPFYHRFIKSFPTVESLAKAKIEKIYKHWAGLGYYSRARNLHKAAKAIKTLGYFPEDHQSLLALPGFGDYTARAVSSQAFNEPVGVVDGNVIRVLSRRYGLPIEHWKSAGKKQLQDMANAYAQQGDPSAINQALMEVGATICQSKTTTCLLCPIKKNCVALKNNLIAQLPLKKAKRQSEIWLWNVEFYQNKNKVALVKNQYAPFLKNQWLLPGKAVQATEVPEKFDFQHAITHHKIYVKITRKRSKFNPAKNAEVTWLTPNQLKEKAPFSLIQKAVDIGLSDK